MDNRKPNYQMLWWKKSANECATVGCVCVHCAQCACVQSYDGTDDENDDDE